MGKLLMGEFIKRERNKQNMTLRDLSAASGVANSTICDIEKGRCRNYANITKLLNVLGLTWEDAETAGVDFFNEGPDIKKQHQSDFDFCVEWLKKMTVTDIANFRKLIELQEMQKNGGNNDESEEDDSGI